MVVHTFKPSTSEAVARCSQGVQASLVYIASYRTEQHNGGTLSQKTNKKPKLDKQIDRQADRYIPS